MNKKAAGNGGILLILLIVVVGLALDQVGVIDLSSIAKGEPAEGVAPVDTIGCGDPTNTLTLGPLKRKWSPTTSMSAVNLRYFRIGPGGGEPLAANDQGSKTDQTTDTVTVGDKFVVINGYSSTAAPTSTYYATYTEGIMPCGSIQTANFDNIYKGNNELVQNGSISLTIYNGDTGNKNAGTGVDNESIGAGQSGTFRIDLFETTDKTGYSAGKDKSGKIGKITMTVEMNSTAYDEESTTLDGKTPNAQAPAYYIVKSTASRVVAFEFSGCPTGDARSCSEKIGTLKVQADATNNPGPGSVESNSVAINGGWLYVCFHDQNWYLNTITGAPSFGYAKDDTTRAGMGEQCFYISVD